MSTAEAVILAIVEGITEFIPVSSTGHLIIFSALMGIETDDYTKLFEIAIQFGAILAVVVLYWKKFFKDTSATFYLKLIVAVIPALILGALFANKIDQLLQSPKIVAFLILAGGVVLLFVDNMFKSHPIDDEKEMTYKNGFIIGIWQCLAMLPGVSRSAASIIGGMQQKLTRRLAAEFSFFLAVPTMAAATGYKILKTYKENPAILRDSHNIHLLLIGNVIAFVVAMVAVKFFITFIQKFGFKYFGWYRIIAGLIMLIFAFFNIIH
jgi:undecaprenyl-diphosphatase